MWIIGEHLIVISALIFLLSITLLWVYYKVKLQIPTTEYQQKLLASLFIIVFFCSTISFTLRYLANVENYIGTFELPAETVSKEINKEDIEQRFLKTKEFIQRKFEK
jgi:pilus assembly protein TadC